jgi:ribosomal protein L30
MGPPVEHIRTLFVTLRRSQVGKPWFHRRVLDALGLRKRLTCVEKPNNPSIRGMLRQVR